MYRKATVRIAIATVLGFSVLHAQPSLQSAIQPANGQSASLQRDWHRVGNSAIDEGLAGLATGPVNRVWYAPSGALFIQTASGRIFRNNDFENWQPALGVPAPPLSAIVTRLPEPAAQVRPALGAPATAYSFATFVYRSDDGGANWSNLTAFRNTSIIGGDLRDLAVSPSNPDDVVVAGGSGVFRSLDGGKSWTSLNQSLPNLPAARLLALPAGDRGVQLGLAQLAANGQYAWSAVEWEPGQKTSWNLTQDAKLLSDQQLQSALSQRFATGVTAVATSGDSIYAGTIDGRIFSSMDRGVSWQPSSTGISAGAIERFWVDPQDPQTALAVLDVRANNQAFGVPAVHVVNTTNGGRFWAPFTGSLPDIGVHGVTVDRNSNAVYLATDAGVFMSYADVHVLGANPQWTPVTGLPPDSVRDVALDAQGNRLWAAVSGYGVYSTLAPHRTRDPRVVHTADLVARSTAPGSLISVLGARVQSARAGDVTVPILSANDNESNLQIPFEARGDSLSLALDIPTGRVIFPVQIDSAAPGIFVDRDGSPVLLDGDSGVMLDALNPAHARGRIQVLATGLGRVTPDWPTGLAGPTENPPQVAAPVKAFLDGQPVDVSRAVLGPYIGYYLVDLEVPKIVNAGGSDLYLEVGGKPSNHVRVYVQP